jgi:hypothetical protein
MKRILATTAMLALALPMLADEPKKSEEPKPQPAQTTTADSPLAAAAKRANRLGKKPTSKVVITNDTLKSSGQNAHVTTTDKLRALPRGQAEPSQEVLELQEREQKRKAAAEAALKKEKEEKERAAKVRYAAQNAEEAYPDDMDPAQAEKQLQDANKPKEEKPPV